MTPIRILIVDDYEPFCRLVRSLLRQRAEYLVVGQAADGLEAVHQAEELQPDLILLDIGLPKQNGMDSAKRICKLAPQSRVLFLTQESSSDVVGEALRLGAMGYVEKLHAGGDLLPAIEAVFVGKRFVGRGLEYEFRDQASSRGNRHEIVFCSDDAVVVDVLAHFIAAALNAGDAAIVWATESHRESIRRRLLEAGVRVDASIQRGIFMLSNVSEPPDSVRMAQAIRKLSEAARRAGKEHPRVAVCGERAGRLWGEGKIDEAIRLEQLLNDLGNVHKVDILCPYPGFRLDENDHGFKDICAEHSAVYSR